MESKKKNYCYLLASGWLYTGLDVTSGRWIRSVNNWDNNANGVLCFLEKKKINNNRFSFGDGRMGCCQGVRWVKPVMMAKKEKKRRRKKKKKETSP